MADIWGFVLFAVLLLAFAASVLWFFLAFENGMRESARVRVEREGADRG